jgi:hypothetical protein
MTLASRSSVFALCLCLIEANFKQIQHGRAAAPLRCASLVPFEGLGQEMTLKLA